MVAPGGMYGMFLEGSSAHHFDMRNSDTMIDVICQATVGTVAVQTTNTAPAGGGGGGGGGGGISKQGQDDSKGGSPEGPSEGRGDVISMGFKLISASTPLSILTELTKHTGRLAPLPAWVDNGAILGVVPTVTHRNAP